jgi:hypothetical protein
LLRFDDGSIFVPFFPAQASGCWGGLVAISIMRGKVRGFLLAKSSGRPAVGSTALLEAEVDNGLWTPVSLLAADHVGYVSFGLQALRAGGRATVLGFRIRANDEVHALRPDLLLDIAAPHFILSVDPPADPPPKGFVSIQDPDDRDRELSPRSFATPPTTLIGEGECAELVPGGLAGFDYGVYRVVRLTRPPGDDRNSGLGARSALLRDVSWSPELWTGGLAVIVDMSELTALPEGSTNVQVGVVLEFRQRWQPIGQSLGDIVYSLPLAPGESRDLAIIDWVRSDTFARQDTTSLSEQLLHHQSRDRTIEEAISAGLHEHQEGWSFLAGTAGAASANIPIEAVNLSISADHALGVGIASSTGERNLAGFSQQDLVDTVAQATSVVRSLRSTVLVQATQQESNVVQTRTITNYNRCHALTVQYYEVLRNYRVVTELVRATPALLLPHDIVTFSEDATLHWRVPLERHLLDPSLADCFEALAHIVRCRETAYAPEPEAVSETPAPTPQPTDERVLAASYEITLDTGARETWGAIWVNLITNDGQRYVIYAKDSVNHASGVAVPDASRPELAALVLARNSRMMATTNANGDGITGIGIDLRNVRKVEVEWVESNGNDAWTFQGIEIDATSSTGEAVPVYINGMRLYSERPEIQRFDDSGSTHLIWTGAAKIADRPTPPAPTTPAQPEKKKESPKMTGRDARADACCAAMLLGHLQDNLAYYSRVVWVGMDPTERRLRLLAAYGQTLVDFIDDRPLAVGGNQVAFRLNGTDVIDAVTLSTTVGTPDPQTQYVNVPARGVFAEAELGRCDACEKRDITHADPWIPLRPPQIGDVRPGPRGETPNVQPTQLPAPVVQVMQAPAAPDPTGLAAALEVLGRPGIFRDMSGMRELRQLLDGLVSGAVSLTEAQILAQQVKQKQSAASGGGAGSTGAPAGSADGATRSTSGAAVRSPAAEPDAAKQIDRLDAIHYATEKGLVDEGGARRAAEGVVGGWLLASADAGVAPPTVSGDKPDASVMVGINGDARLKESFDKLVSDGWEIRRTNIWFGNSSVNTTNRVLYIDDDVEPVATTTAWATDAVRKAYQADNDYRRKAIRDKAIGIFNDATLTDLEKMARTYEWAVWFWRYPSDNGDGGRLLDDMMLVLTELDTDGVSSNDGTYNIFRGRRTSGADSAGFKYAFRDDSNQVRHATGSMQASFSLGLGGLGVMQLRESSTSADWRLNSRCYDIATGLKALDPRLLPKDIGAILRRELGDPAQTGPWTGLPDGDPAAPMP